VQAAVANQHGVALRVVLLHYTAPPVVGGVESVVAAQARWLREAGYPVTVLAGRGKGPQTHIVDQLYGRHPDVQHAHRALTRGDLQPLLHLQNRLVRELRPHLMGSVCLAHNVFTLAKNLPLLGALHRLVEEELDCRWVAWTHDVLWDSPTDVLPIPLGSLQELLRHARPELTYVATSEAVRASLVRHLGVDGSRVRVIPPGVCLESLGLVSPQTRRILQELAWEDHFPVLLVPVRVTRRKNLELAVQVAACLRAEGLDPLVAVTGPLGAHTAANARYLQELQELRRRLGLNEQVAFLVERGIRCSARTVGELYLACDAVLIPSVLEGFGLPVAEAGLLRVPVFCSRIPAAVEVAGQLAHFFSVDEPPESVARRIARELELDRAARLRRQVVERLGCRHVASKALGTLVAELASAAGR